MAFLGLFFSVSIQAMGFFKGIGSIQHKQTTPVTQFNEKDSEYYEQLANEVRIKKAKEGAAVGALFGLGATWLAIRNTDDSVPSVVCKATQYAALGALTGGFFGYRNSRNEYANYREIAAKEKQKEEERVRKQDALARYFFDATKKLEQEQAEIAQLDKKINTINSQVDLYFQKYPNNENN